VTERLAVRECLCIGKQQIPLHVWVSVFVNGNAGSRVGAVHHTNAALDTAFCHRSFDLCRYRNEARDRRGEMVRIEHDSPPYRYAYLYYNTIFCFAREGKPNKKKQKKLWKMTVDFLEHVMYTIFSGAQKVR
jgi:hypothetical protein